MKRHHVLIATTLLASGCTAGMPAGATIERPAPIDAGMSRVMTFTTVNQLRRESDLVVIARPSDSAYTVSATSDPGGVEQSEVVPMEVLRVLSSGTPVGVGDTILVRQGVRATRRDGTTYQVLEEPTQFLLYLVDFEFYRGVDTPWVIPVGAHAGVFIDLTPSTLGETNSFARVDVDSPRLPDTLMAADA